MKSWGACFSFATPLGKRVPFPSHLLVLVWRPRPVSLGTPRVAGPPKMTWPPCTGFLGAPRFGARASLERARPSSVGRKALNNRLVVLVARAMRTSFKDGPPGGWRPMRGRRAHPGEKYMSPLGRRWESPFFFGGDWGAK